MAGHISSLGPSIPTTGITWLPGPAGTPLLRVQASPNICGSHIHNCIYSQFANAPHHAHDSPLFLCQREQREQIGSGVQRSMSVCFSAVHFLLLFSLCLPVSLVQQLSSILSVWFCFYNALQPRKKAAFYKALTMEERYLMSMTGRDLSRVCHCPVSSIRKSSMTLSPRKPGESCIFW